MSKSEAPAPSMTPSTLDALERLLAAAKSDSALTDDVTALHVAAVNALPALIAAARENARLREALERTLWNFQAWLAQRPVRDATERIAEARAILQQTTDASPGADDGG